MHANKQSGFSLLEMIMVIVITGIIGGMVAVFFKAPVQQYVDVARRAELTDIADTAFQRLLRDMRTAVPNSVRSPAPGGSTYIEFMPAKNGGRYRAHHEGGVLCDAVPGNTEGAALSFEAADTCFEIIGPSMTFAAGDWIVVGSTQSDGSLPYDNTVTGVLRAYAGAAGAPQSSVVITSTNPFPRSAELDGQRFQVVDGTQQAVTYACEGVNVDPATGDGTGVLRRYWQYGFYASQPAPPITAQALVPGNATPVRSAILADKISNCNFVYDVVNQRNALVALTLSITRGGETVSLYEEVHVNNAP